MRIPFALICLAFAGAAPALETARGLAVAGAPHLALARVEQLQPRESAAPRWAEWETLRFALLVEIQRYDEALRRAAALPTDMPLPALRFALLAAARAAVAAGQGALARAYAARLLWRLDAEPGEARAARLLVIESYLSERQGEAAFRAMLRFEQDYRPLERAASARFAEALLDLGLDREAVNWLAGLEDASPIKLRVQLRAGLISADAAIAQARLRLSSRAKEGGDAGYWLVLAEAAGRKGDGALRAEALERLLNHAGASDERGVAARADELWRAYLAEAQAIANRSQVLAGDDKAWADLAARRHGANAVDSRALLAYLVRNGMENETRRGAQLQLAFSLYQSGLDHSALQLFSGKDVAVGELDPGVRHLLGEIAEKRNRPALAVRFWQGLASAPGAGAEEWQVRVAEMQWRAGAADAAIGTLRALAKATNALPGPAANRVLALAREASGGGRPAAAEDMLSAVLPVAGREDARVLLHALGGIAESAAQFARAADYYLRAVLIDGARASDALALQSRLAAGVNLARAGHRGDARAQLQWVIDHSRDAGQIERARRALSGL